MSSTREARLAVACPLVACAALLWLFGSRDLDARVCAWFYDAETGSFPYRGAYWAKDLLHDAGRDAVFAIAASCLLCSVAGGFWKRLRRARRALLYAALAIGVSTGTVAALRSASATPCPWDSTRFGGDIPHLDLFEAPPTGARPGRCFPGAHAAGGFALMAFYYVLRERRTSLAWGALGAGWIVGSLFAATQVARGAHFPSHNVWSAVIAWTACTTLYWLGFRGRLWNRSAEALAPSAP